MPRSVRRPARTQDGANRARKGSALAALLLLVCAALPAPAAEHVPYPARAGLDIARAAAQSWAPDAALVYLENDEDLDAAGIAGRWGYVFYSSAAGKARVYSVREGRILVAEDLAVKVEPPPVADGWIDSGAALAAAERGAGEEFRRKHGGQLSTMLLMRGAFHDEDPDQTTWLLVYTVPGQPSLFVVVDATEGRVRRTWRG